MGLLENEKFNPDKTTIFYIHGYVQPVSCVETEVVLQAYLNQKGKYNVIQIAWTKYAFGDYATESVQCVPVVSIRLNCSA